MKKTDKQEILEAIQGLDQKLSAKIDAVDHRLSNKIDAVDQKLSAKIDGLDKKIDGVEQNLTEQIELMAEEVHSIDTRLKRIEALMVTKDYLDMKLAVQHSDTVNYVKDRVSCWKDRSVLKTAN